MADSNAIKAGAAYVELFTRNNLKPGIDAAKQDLASLQHAGQKAASAQLSTEAKLKMAQEAASNRMSAYAAKLATVATVVWSVKAAFTNMHEKAMSVFDEQIDRFDELAKKQRDLFDLNKSKVDWKLALGSPAGQLAATQKALAGLNVAGAAAQKNRAEAALDEFKKKNAMLSFTGGVRLMEKTDNPFGYGDFIKAELKGLESAFKDAEKNYAQVKAAAEGYESAIRKLSDPAQNADLVANIDQATEALKEQAATFLMTSEQAQRWKFAQRATPEMLKGFDAAAAAKRMEEYNSPLAAREFRIKEAEDYAEKTSQALEAYLEGQERKRDIDESFAQRQQDAMMAMKSSFGAFGANLQSGMFGGQGGLVTSMKELIQLEREKAQVDKQVLKVQEKILGEIGDRAQ